jgi:ribosome-interacting GTPase 1
MGILEKISEIEKEIARTQKNKGIASFQMEMSYTTLHENML